MVNGNTACRKLGSRGGAGGYISGTIRLPKQITAFATIGGHGLFHSTSIYDNFNVDEMIPGGYGGGGYSFNYYSVNYLSSASGGGQTTVKFLENDLWHRVIVSGGGGGSDNVHPYINEYGTTDDGSGGSGGGLIAQGFWINGIYNSSYLANSTSGFTFGSGESAQEFGSISDIGVREGFGGTDRSGAGSGWFGGFASHNGNGGSGGGSSWVLSEDADIPDGNIAAKGPFFNITDERPYFFRKTDGYLFYDIVNIPGVWEGNGKLVITILDKLSLPSCFSVCYLHFSYHLLFVLFIDSPSN
ncbi:gp13, putative [Trichomonas vaginalis G3]|uniref:receptor protein-tyrosine kinase n=1 Tax=Trichomonas vaginalis (strain ATCC PRA-98 / G3) TaxID=412133 RepID=A2E8P0_TRIV3|nr:glycine-rich protein family [Trichomonas vaginalis G3]EAY10979.1 gp13, putative [Trichomonas vaginalis G3]KAI5530820.1 glycine-rich protein family [Trichomonas vaginalis G3]|eukprot:XP_001323202.1 gp13 [Trichomonas vaginalis G3]